MNHGCCLPCIASRLSLQCSVQGRSHYNVCNKLLLSCAVCVVACPAGCHRQEGIRSCETGLQAMCSRGLCLMRMCLVSGFVASTCRVCLLPKAGPLVQPCSYHSIGNGAQGSMTCRAHLLEPFLLLCVHLTCRKRHSIKRV